MHVTAKVAKIFAKTAKKLIDINTSRPLRLPFAFFAFKSFMFGVESNHGNLSNGTRAASLHGRESVRRELG
jgi:hypothetical protein